MEEKTRKIKILFILIITTAAYHIIKNKIKSASIDIRNEDQIVHLQQVWKKNTAALATIRPRQESQGQGVPKHKNSEFDFIQTLPTSLRDIEMTENIRAAIDSFQLPDSYIYYDYIIRTLFDAKHCFDPIIVNENEEKSIQVTFTFRLSTDKKTGLSPEINAYESNLSSEQAINFAKCLSIVAQDDVYDTSILSLEKETFTVAHTFEFPIQNNFIYKIIKTDGKIITSPGDLKGEN